MIYINEEHLTLHFIIGVSNRLIHIKHRFKDLETLVSFSHTKSYLQCNPVSSCPNQREIKIAPKRTDGKRPIYCD